MQNEYIAVIGTAGRRDDADRLSRAAYDSMYADLLDTMKEWGVRSLVSGGAAWADHLAVRAFLEGDADRLVLFLPAHFSRRQYVPNPRVPSNPGATANRYHREFSRVCGIDSLAEIDEAIRRGAQAEVYEGFKRRNTEVADLCTHMIAYTFGSSNARVLDFQRNESGFTSHSEAGLKDGGTAHTWEQAWKSKIKRHVDLGLGMQPSVEAREAAV